MVRGDLTIAEIISKYNVPKSVASKWKRQLLDNGATIFSGNIKSTSLSPQAVDIDKLHAAIGKLKVENDFLHQVSERLKL
jgi:transposase-like protein